MEKDRRNHEVKKTLEPKIGEPEYLNKNCWLVGNLKSNPYKRCQYCESRFRNCLFLQYQTISAFLIGFFIILSFFIKGKISEIELILLIVFSFVIIYGYFFNKSTDRLIQAYFSQTKAKKALEELTKKLEEKVEEQTKEIKEAFKKVNELSRWKSELLSIVAHQIKNPLAIVKGYASLITDKTISDSKAIEEAVEKIKAAANKLLKLLNNLLDFHHIEEGKMHYEFQKLELNNLLKDLIDGFQIIVRQKELDLIFEPASSEIYTNADIYKLSQVFQNLLDNSIKYTERGWVRIKIEADKRGFILITISDSGRGMNKELLSKLFQRFSRGVEKKQVLGTGLGLYIAKEIIEDHQGEIWAESEGEGKGSRFYVRLKNLTS